MKKDPFESYEERAEYLKNLPMTWYPALIITMVEAAYEKKVFVKPDGASKFVAITERRLLGESTTG